jgi:hypothetical protein
VTLKSLLFSYQLNAEVALKRTMADARMFHELGHERDKVEILVKIARLLNHEIVRLRRLYRMLP